MDKAPIVMIVDRDAVIPFAAAVKSIADTALSPVGLFVLTTGTDEGLRDLILRTSERNVSVSVIDASSYLPDIERFKSTHPHVHCNALLKFFIPEILGDYDKVLYLDADIIVQKDLSALLDTDIEDVYAAVVENLVRPNGKKDDVIHKRGSFNSGVMLFNCRKMREDGISRKLFAAKCELADDRYMDQTAFNAVLGKQVRLLPLKFNYLAVFDFHDLREINSYYGTCYASSKELEEDLVILHLAGPFKPWKYADGYYAKLWTTLYRNSAVAADLPLGGLLTDPQGRRVGPFSLHRQKRFRILRFCGKTLCILYRDGTGIKTRFFKSAEQMLSRGGK